MRAMARVTGKIAIVTGAASGIGRACAQRLAAEGASVLVTDRDDRGATLVAASLGPPHLAHALDVTDEAAWKTTVDLAVATFGRVDVLVNAAGIGAVANIEDTTLAQWRLVQAVNSDGVFLGCREVFRAMKPGGGSIVNISSVAGLIGDGDLPAYCASKGAVRLLSKAVALHGARRGANIRCNSVHPGFIATPMVDALAAAYPDPVAARERLANANPLRRIGEVDDVASLVLYLASDESKFVTGAELVVDGGATAR
jgi:3(or 17)beta-hydroxysteroid dehydrogenase